MYSLSSHRRTPDTGNQAFVDDLRTMYGTLDAAAEWAEHYSQVLRAAGFTQGVASPCHFWHKRLEVHFLVHGDDFLVVGRSEGRAHTLHTLQAAYELKHQTVGPSADQTKALKVLGRIVTYHQWGYTVENDPTLIETAVHRMGMENACGVASPGVRPDEGVRGREVHQRRCDAQTILRPEEEWPDHDGTPVLDSERHHRYQSVAALLNYVGLDRPDIAFSVRELMRRMSCPTEQDESRLKRVV